MSPVEKTLTGSLRNSKKGRKCHLILNCDEEKLLFHQISSLGNASAIHNTEFWKVVSGTCHLGTYSKFKVFIFFNWRTIGLQYCIIFRCTAQQFSTFTDYIPLWASLVVLVVKNQPANTGDIRDADLIPGLGRSPGEGKGNPLWYSWLENSMGWGAW